MSAGVSAVSGAAATDWDPAQRPGASPPAFASEVAADARAHQPAPSRGLAVLHLPEEQAFKIATINERLASTAARAEPVGGALDVKA